LAAVPNIILFSLAPVAARTPDFSAADRTDLPGIDTHPPTQRVGTVLKGTELFLRRGGTDVALRKAAPDRISPAAPGAAHGQQFVIVRGREGKTSYLHSGGRPSKKNRARSARGGFPGGRKFDRDFDVLEFLALARAVFAGPIRHSGEAGL
jgi:hypothetical protein